jgi:hypothetical protein
LFDIGFGKNRSASELKAACLSVIALRSVSHKINALAGFDA